MRPAIGDLVHGMCMPCGGVNLYWGESGYSLVREVKNTPYGWARLTLLCSCGSEYEGSTLNRKKVEQR